MNFKKTLFICAVFLSQTAAANPPSEGAILQKQLRSRAQSTELSEPLINGLFNYFSSLQSLSTTTLRQVVSSESLFQSLLKELPKLDPVSLYRLSTQARSELAKNPQDLYSKRLKELHRQVDLRMKVSGIMTPEQGAASDSKVAINDNLLSLCYVKHPLLQDLTMGVSDEEFANDALSNQRKIKIRLDFKNSPQTLTFCYNSVVDSAKMQGDPDTLKHFATRLSEVREVVHSHPGHGAGGPVQMGSAE